jgi:hypothetical protein
MTPDTTNHLGILDPEFMARMGESPSSIAYAQTRRLDEMAVIRDRAETENPTPLLTIEPGAAFPAPTPIDTIEIGFDSIPVVADPIATAADRIEAGEPLLDVFGDLCRPPMEKL